MIKNITGTPSSISVYIDDKILKISGELTATPIFYADKNSITKWEPPHDKVIIDNAEKKNHNKRNRKGF